MLHASILIYANYNYLLLLALVITALEMLEDALQRKMDTCSELNQDLFSKVIQSYLLKTRKL